MRRVVILCALAMMAGVVAAQEPAGGITYGDFALLVVETVADSVDPDLDPQGALDLLKGYGFAPLGWRLDGVLTQADLAGALAVTAATYQAMTPEAVVSRAEAVDVLRSQRSELAEYFADLEGEDCTHGEFAILLVRTVSAPGDEVPDAETALDILKRAGLIPLGWLVPEILTHGELADVLARLGVLYEIIDRDDPVSLPFAIVILRRELSMVKDYWAKRTGHGFSTSHVLDLGVDRAVSPSAFYYRAHVHRGP